MQAPRALGRLPLRQLGRRNFHQKTTVYPTYNDLPQPKGRWKPNYDAIQRKYNSDLYFGIGTLVVTLIVGQVAGYFQCYGDIPDHPATIDSYK